jgi:rhamnosyltransferase
MLWKEHSAVAYGRQLPRADAKAQARHVRLFNYPRNSQVKTHDDIPRLGIKTAFCSNCFAAYTKTCFKDLGGFSTGLIFGEDMEFAARAIRSGRAVAYAADACVYHSHDYRIVQEFRRAFDIGVFHAQQPWILEYFGRAGGEGLRLIRSELRYLARHDPEGILPAVAANAAKFLGYTLGIRHAIIPGTWKKFLSMHGYFWVNG